VQASNVGAELASATPATTIDAYVGKHFGGGAQAIGSATIYPSSDLGFASALIRYQLPVDTLTINMWAKATAPANARDGTLLATSGALAPGTTQAVTLTSTDQVTTWNYVWFEIQASKAGATNVTAYAAEVQFFSPPGTGAGNAVVVQLLGPPLLYTQPIITWRLGAYSNTTGWPTCGCYSDGRLWLSGAIDNRFDASTSNAISPTSGNDVNFAPTDQNGVVGAANGISYTLNSDSVNPIFWMAPDQQGIKCGTQAGEWLIYAPTAGGIAPNNIAAHKTTNAGSANIEPRHTEHTLVFVQRYARKINECFPDVFSGKFTVPNLAEKAMHLTRNGILELAYQQAVTPIVWARDAIGSLLGIVYKRDTLMTSQGPTFAGWFRRTLGSGRAVESISVGPSTGGNLDALAMVTNDPTTNIRHVEIMTDMLDEQATLAQAAYLDDATAGTSYTISNSTPAPYGGLTVNGLWHLNGKTVQAWIGGLDCGAQEGGNTYSDFLVTNGSIVIPFGDGISAGSGQGLFTAAFVASFTMLPIVIGFTYNSDAQLVRPATPQETGARNGPALGKKRRNMQIGMLLNNAQGVSVGTKFTKLQPALFKQFEGGPNLTPLQTFSGVWWDTLPDESSYDGMVCWRVSRPYPCNVMAVEPFLATQDK
jgi:hypothetical protein